MATLPPPTVGISGWSLQSWMEAGVGHNLLPQQWVVPAVLGESGGWPLNILPPHQWVVPAVLSGSGGWPNSLPQQSVVPAVPEGTLCISLHRGTGDKAPDGTACTIVLLLPLILTIVGCGRGSEWKKQPLGQNQVNDNRFRRKAEGRRSEWPNGVECVGPLRCSPGIMAITAQRASSPALFPSLPPLPAAL